MQFSLPILPFDPSVAKAGANATPSSRSTDANFAGADTDFGDLLPANPSVISKTDFADKSSLGLRGSKRPIQSTDDSDSEQSEVPTDENEEPAAKDPSENWFIANGFAQRFVANTPPSADMSVKIGDLSSAEAGEGTDTISEEPAGGKATGLTQPMPATAQGDGRARAILNRAERKPFVVPSPEQPTVPMAPNPAAVAEPAPVTSTEESSEGIVANTAPNAAAIESANVASGSQNVSLTPNAGVTPTQQEETSEESVVGQDPIEESSTVDQSAAQPDSTLNETVTSDVSNVPASTLIASTAESFASFSELNLSQSPAPAKETASVLPDDELDAAVASTETTTGSSSVALGSGMSVGDAATAGKGVPSGNAFPLADSEKLSTAPGLANAAEKFAAGFDRRRGISNARGNPAEIKSLSIDKEQVATESFGLGINAAKTQLSMAATATNSDLPSSLTPSMTTEAVSAASALSHQAKDESQAGASVSAARRAVESAIAIAEHFSGADHRSVNLQFSVSGVDLAVRVELRGDAVHTTFRTDSPELRAALAHEWQVVNSQPSERPVRLADPVFASNTNGSATQSDTHSSQHRESAARGQFSAEQFPGFRSSGRSAQASTVAATTTTSATLHESVSTSGRLRTFA